MYIASIWDKYMGAIWVQRSIIITHLYGTYKGHISHSNISHICETVVPGIYLLFDKMHVHNR